MKLYSGPWFQFQGAEAAATFTPQANFLVDGVVPAGASCFYKSGDLAAVTAGRGAGRCGANTAINNAAATSNPTTPPINGPSSPNGPSTPNGPSPQPASQKGGSTTPSPNGAGTPGPPTSPASSAGEKLWCYVMMMPLVVMPWRI